MKPKPAHIIVVLEGGVIQNICRVEGTLSAVVEVRDFDVEGHDEYAHGPLLRDDDGNQFIRTMWMPDDQEPTEENAQ